MNAELKMLRDENAQLRRLVAERNEDIEEAHELIKAMREKLKELQESEWDRMHSMGH